MSKPILISVLAAGLLVGCQGVSARAAKVMTLKAYTQTAAGVAVCMEHMVPGRTDQGDTTLEFEGAYKDPCNLLAAEMSSYFDNLDARPDAGDIRAKVDRAVLSRALKVGSQYQ